MNLLAERQIVVVIMETLLEEIRKCEVCIKELPLGPRPVVQLGASSKIVIIGQAPGRRVHQTGIPWDDASGRKLREWMNVDEVKFYDADIFSILPMGFCYPGKGDSGDLSPRGECAPLWHAQFLNKLTARPLILLIGQYAQRYYLHKQFKGSLTETVRNYQEFLPEYFPLPHPSPRNQNWVKINPWFMKEVVPALRNRIKTAASKEKFKFEPDE
jgi:uracil-DNA glycosylase